jgi:heat shock protein HtpX
MWLQIRMYLLLGLMFAILYALITVVVPGTWLLYGILASMMLFFQYMIGPKMVEWSMKIKYVSETEEPELHSIVEELARQARIPKPRVGVSTLGVPNAFAFGRWLGDGRVCVTEGILRLLSRDELRAVLGHEISHLKNRDVTVITMLSVIPTICWYIAWSTMWGGYGRGRDRGGAAYVGIVAFLLYFITNLLVLYGSRIREYYADRGSVKLGNAPHHLATALYKLVYGSARVSTDALKQMEGYKAFFLNDPSRARSEIQELKQVDTDLSGTIDQNELLAIRTKKVTIGTADKLMEMFSTHPNMLKRIRHLSEL